MVFKYFRSNSKNDVEQFYNIYRMYIFYFQSILKNKDSGEKSLKTVTLNLIWLNKLVHNINSPLN